MRPVVGTFLLGTGLLLAGCGDQFTGQAQKAVEQITVEASKVASKQIEAFKTDTVEQLKKMQGGSEKEKGEENSKDKEKSKDKLAATEDK